MPDNPFSFAKLPAGHITASELEKEAGTFLDAWTAARSAEEELEVIRRWDHAQIRFETQRSLSRIRYEQDTSDPERRARESEFEQLDSEMSRLNRQFLLKVLDSSHRGHHERRLGPHAFTLWQQQIGIIDPRLAPLEEREAELVRRYREILANMRLDIDGKAHTLSSMRPATLSPDRARRFAARLAMDRGFAAHQDELDGLFTELVELRHEMARTLSFRDFIALGYRRMQRTDYGPEEVERFRQQLVEHVVPVVAAIRARRAAALGIDDPAFHDEGVLDPRGPVVPIVSGDGLVHAVEQVLREVAPAFAEVFRDLAARGFVDVEPRPGKVTGASAESLPEHGVPVILANFKGTYDDVIALLHECGHALQYWCARHQLLRDYHWPSNEACEIESIGMELLAHPHLALFFGADAERFRDTHLEDSLSYLLWDTSADAFQHLVYARPDASVAERQAMWKQVEQTFLPWRCYPGLPWLASGRAWQTYSLIYRVPFYGIDYALALICALQLWARARVDRRGTLQTYRTLCALGGSMPFQQLLASAELDSPFEPDIVERIVEQLVQELDI